MSKLIDLFSGKPPEFHQKARVTINNKDVYSKIKVGNIYMNQYVIVAMICMASDDIAKTYELRLRKL